MGNSGSAVEVCVDNPQTPYQYSRYDTIATPELLDRIYDEIKPQLEEAANLLEAILKEYNQAFYYEKDILRVSYTENGIQKYAVLSRDLRVKMMSKLLKIPFTVVSTHYGNGRQTLFLRVIQN